LNKDILRLSEAAGLKEFANPSPKRASLVQIDSHKRQGLYSCVFALSSEFQMISKSSAENAIDNQLQDCSVNLLPRQIKYRLASVENFNLSCKYKPVNETVEMIQFLNSFRERKVEMPIHPKLNGDLLEHYWTNMEKRGKCSFRMLFT
jgi:hypothetical protein